MKLLKLASPYQLYISGDNLLVESATSGVCHTSIIVLLCQSNPLVARVTINYDQVGQARQGACILVICW